MVPVFRLVSAPIAASGVITLVESSVITLAQATERNPPPLILPVKPPHARARNRTPLVHAND